MNNPKSTIGKDVRKYCATIGADSLLVQGAGGNISWKEDDTLWIKASGTWLSNAEDTEIFIPVDLVQLKHQISKKKFAVAPKILSDVKLKPSIETMLHALMQHRVVLHLHPIEVLAHLVRSDITDYLTAIAAKQIRFSLVEYKKPGADLASTVANAIKKQPLIDVILLKNHGVVIGGETVEDVHSKLCMINQASVTKPFIEISNSNVTRDLPDFLGSQYAAVADPHVHKLARVPDLCDRLQRDWALYPDHVVFLGAKPHIYDSWAKFHEEIANFDIKPELIFIIGDGVYSKKSFTKAKQAQLRCYLEIMIRQDTDQQLTKLTDRQIAELLTWGAEQYRQRISIQQSGSK